MKAKKKKKKERKKSGKSGMYKKQQLEIFDQKTVFD